MKQNLDRMIRHMVAWAGGDPCQVQLPRLKSELHIHSQRIGDLHLIAVTRPHRQHPSGYQQDQVQQSTETGTLVLCGVIVTLRGTDAAWLVMAGAGMIPIAGATAQVDAELQALNHRRVVLKGACSTQGLVVQAVQPIEEAQ
jgi:hypothetical protein